MDYVILVSFIFITVVESRRLDASGFVSPTRNFGRRNGIHGLGINQMNAQLRRTNHRIIIHKIDFHSARIPILKTSTCDESSDENPTIMPTTGASSRRAPRKRITNKYGLIESNDERLPEKSEEKRRREASRFVNRQKKQVEKVNEEIRNNHVMRIGEGDDSFQSLAKVEEMARGKCNGANGDMSQRILINFQSAMEEQKLENLTDELVACKTLNAKGDRIPLSAIILPRDQTSLIRLLGAKGAYTSMLNLLRHLEESMNISGSQYAYTAAITALAQSSNRRWRAQAITLLDEMDEKAIPPNTYTFTATFLAVDGGKAALELLNRAKSSKSKSVEVGIHLYNGAIHACSRNDLNGENGWQTALSLLRTQMPRDGIEPNEQTYTSVIHACAKSGQLKVAMSIFDELRSTRGIPERSANKVWGAILRACATTGDSSKAMELMRDMLSSNVRPNTLHYNSVLSALAKEGNDKMAVELLDRMVAGTVQSFVLDGEKSQTVESDGVVQRTGAMPDLISINTVLTSFVKSENYNGAKQFFRRVKLGEFMYDRLDSRAVIRPDIISYNSLLSVCKDSREAKIIMQEIRTSRRSRMYAVKPTSVTYTNAIGACKRTNPPDMDTALYFLEEANKDGVKQNVFMYSAAIWTAERCGDAKTAIFLLASMRSNRCTPNAVSYDGALSALASRGKFDEACSMFRIMKKDRVEPTAITFQKLALACQKCDCPAKTIVECLEEVLSQLDDYERRAVMSGPVHNMLIREYGNLNDFDNALRVFESIDRVNAQILNSILFVCSAVSPVRWQDAIILLHTSDIVAGAAGRGRIEYSALSCAVIACSKENQWKEGLNLLNIYGSAMNGGNPKTSVDAVNSVIAAAGRDGRPDEAIRILNEMGKYGVVPNERTYRSVVVACNQAEHEKRRQRQRQYRLKDSSILQSGRRDQPAFQDDDPINLQWWEAALSLFRRMKEEDLTPDIQTYSSVISACEAAGQWQRAIGVLRFMMSDDASQKPNKFCFNAAIAACEKGGAWLEAVELYERMRQQVKPNFITMNSLLIALENADQKEMAENMYREALKDKTVRPWKLTLHENSKRIYAMDLHQFSAPMAKIAVRNVLDSLMSARPVHDKNKDLIIIVGKGKGSEDGIRVLMPQVKKLLNDEYGMKSSVDDTNSGRLLVRSEDLIKFVAR